MIEIVSRVTPRAARRALRRAPERMEANGIGILRGILLCANAGGAAAYDPASESLAGWWRASYSGSPWAGTASAGSSGSYNLTEATNPPQTGTAVNGYTPAKWDRDVANHVLSNATAVKNNFMTTTAFTAIALVNPAGLGADDASPFAEQAVVLDTEGYWSLNLTTSGTRVYSYGSAAHASPYTAVSTSAWSMIVGKLDGGFLYSKVNSGSWSAGTAAAASTITGTATLAAGRNYANNQFLKSSVLEIMLATSALSDGTLDNIRGYFNTRYSLAL